MISKTSKQLLVIALSMTSYLGFAKDPFSIYPFEIPEKYSEDLHDYRTDWTRLTGFEYSGLHWQQFIAIYINREADVYTYNFNQYIRYYQDLEEYDEDEISEPIFKKYTPGTIILKENFAAKNGSPDTPLTITMMIKHAPGYDPQNGDWEYVQSTSSGEIILSGNEQDPAVKTACANCHINIAERDYIFTNFYSTGGPN